MMKERKQNTNESRRKYHLMFLSFFFIDGQECSLRLWVIQNRSLKLRHHTHTHTPQENTTLQTYDHKHPQKYTKQNFARYSFKSMSV